MNKKGVSVIVSYVFLTVIVITLSFLTYTYLKNYLPSDKAECPEGISLIATNLSCHNKILYVELVNKGMFNVTNVFLRLGVSNRSVGLQINKGNKEILIPPLGPGQQIIEWYDVDSYVTGDGDYFLEIEPALVIDRNLVLCEKAIVDYPVTCDTI